MRQESEIFADLERMCSSPGYVHVIAYFCFRDNAIGFDDQLTAKDFLTQYSDSRLIRTEVSTLIGLLIKAKVDLVLPDPETFQNYIRDTEALLNEMHQSLGAPMHQSLLNAVNTASADREIKEKFNPFTSGAVLREPIFYGSESAYSFQYRDMAPLKYADDENWLDENKGFSIKTASDVARAIGEIQNEKLMITLRQLKKIPPHEWTMLPAFTFSVQEVAAHTGIESSGIERILSAFAITPGNCNAQFNALYEFNVFNAAPFIRVDENTFILLQFYSLVEALYEAPFYWMGADKKYVAKAMEHRGRFTEEFSRRRLERVFDNGRVYSNITILESKSTTVGEIDVLVIFGNRAIVLQSKSKRLTLEAKKGNDGQIKDDFKKGIQDAYDQGYLCAKLLTDDKYKFLDAEGNVIKITERLGEIYLGFNFEVQLPVTC